MQSSMALHVPLANFPCLLRQSVPHLLLAQLNLYSVSSHCLASINFNGPSFSVSHTYIKYSILNHEKTYLKAKEFK